MTRDEVIEAIACRYAAVKNEYAVSIAHEKALDEELDEVLRWIKPQRDDPAALTIKKAVAASSISRSMLYLALGRGELQAKKFGKTILIMQSELERFLNNLPVATFSTPKRDHKCSA